MSKEATVFVPDEPTRRERAVLPMPPDPNATPMQLLAIMTQRGVSTSDLKDLVAMAKDWEAGQAKKEYDKAFAAFKAESVQVIRNVTVTDGPLKGKSYADLCAAVDAAVPMLSKHGLSHRWKTTKDEKDWIEMTCVLSHVAGHSESESHGGPPDTGGAKNPIQARSSTRTYLERTSFLAVTGLAAKNQDTDGNTIKVKVEQEPKGFSEWADNLEGIVTEGQKAFDEAWAKADPKYRRYTIKFEEEWFNALRDRARKVQP